MATWGWIPKESQFPVIKYVILHLKETYLNPGTKKKKFQCLKMIIMSSIVITL